MGWSITLRGGWRVAFISLQTAFTIGFIGLCVLLMRKLPVRSIRAALLGLVAAYAYLIFDGIWLACGRWYVRPFLFSEMAVLVALWFAYETSHTLSAPSS